MLNEKNFNYLGHATLDPIGRVFEYQGGIYRGIYKDKVGLVKELFETGLLQELIDQKLLVSSEITDLTSETYPLIIRHERITPTTPLEWTFSMLKDAAHTIKEVNEICNKLGYELLDAHPFNILFKKNSPVWVDLGSIGKLENPLVWRAKEEFIDFTLFPSIYSVNTNFLRHIRYFRWQSIFSFHREILEITNYIKYLQQNIRSMVR